MQQVDQSIAELSDGRRYAEPGAEWNVCGAEQQGAACWPGASDKPTTGLTGNLASPRKPLIATVCPLHRSSGIADRSNGHRLWFQSPA